MDRRRPTTAPAPTFRTARLARRARQGGFNFAEVLFAVMILGIGFIMVAAIFPVALMQSKQTQEETAAAGTARGGANYLEQLATNAIMPATGVEAKGAKLAGTTIEGCEVHALDDVGSVAGSMLLAADQRYAWKAFYRRKGTRPPGGPGDWSTVAQVYMLPVAVRNRSQFDKGIEPVIQTFRDLPVGGVVEQRGVPRLVAEIVDSTAPGAANPDDVDFIEFDNITANNDEGRFTAIAEGAYVIVAGAPPAPANSTAADPTGAHARVGHIFRIGNPTPTQPDDIASNNPTLYPRRWELVPGNDYVPLPGDYDAIAATAETSPLTLPDLTVFVVGRSKITPGPGPTWDANDNPYDGLSQDVAAYTTFVNIR